MPKILVIDDEPHIRELLQIVLEGAGFEVAVAKDGNEGIKLYRKIQPDLVITDLIMPGKEGIETIREIKAENPAAKIIAVSGGGRVNANGYLQLALKLGAARSLSKPVSRENLLAAVNELLS